MTERTTDEEKLAALLDGRLEEGEREALLSRLVASPELLDAYAEAVAVTRELEAEDEAQGVVALGERRRRWFQRPGVRVLAAAAGLAVIVAVPWSLGRGGDAPLEPSEVVAMLGAGAGPVERPASAWPVRRSSTVVAAERGVALRLGAELAWLEIALSARDPEGVGRSASQIETLLEGLPAAAPLASVYHSVAADPRRPASELRPLLDQAGSSVQRIAGEELVWLGAWVEMARVATDRQDEEFFRSQEARERLGSVLDGKLLSPSAREALSRVLTLAGARPLPWAELETELRSLPELLTGA